MLEAIDKVIAGIKVLRDIAEKTKNAELRNTIADLQMASADLKLEVVELKSEIVRVRDESEALKRKRDLRSKMRIDGNLCYLTQPIPGYDEGPFCPVCVEVDGLLIPMYYHRHTDSYSCPHCARVRKSGV